MSEKKQPKKRMMHRRDFATARDKIKKRDDAREALTKALEKMCDEHSKPKGASDWWPDCVNVELGYVAVADKTGDYRDNMGDRHRRERLSKKDREELREYAEKLKQAEQNVQELMLGIAIRYGVPIDAIKPNTGEVTVGEDEVEQMPGPPEDEESKKKAKGTK